MTADQALFMLFGMVAGFSLGYVTAWRFARKLEHHNVELAAWDTHFDAGAGPREQSGKVIGKIG